MTRRNSLIQEFCIDKEKTEQDSEALRQTAYIPLFNGIRPQTQKDELYVYQKLIGSSIEDPIRDVTSHLWFYSGKLDSDGESSLRLKISNPSSTLLYNKRDRSVFITSEERTIGRNGINKIDELVKDGNEYVDIVFDQYVPTTLSTNNIRHQFSVTTKNNYNFYNEQYEKKAGVQTSGLPNYYIFNENSEIKKYYNLDLVNYSGSIDTIQAIDEKYVHKFSSTVIPEQALNYVSKKMSNIVFSQKRNNNYLEYNNSPYKEEIFPFYLELEFNKSSPGLVLRSLQNDNAVDYFLAYMATRENNQDLETLPFSSVSNKSEPEVNVDIDIIPLNYEWLQSLPEFSLNDDSVTYLGEKTSINDIQLFNFFTQQGSLLENDFRDYQDILDGKSCYTEDLFYKIEKYEVSGRENIKIQSFFVANKDDAKIHLIDTQVKYGKKYRYEIYAYKYVLANRYKYINKIEGLEQNFLTRTFTVQNNPEAYIVKVLFATANEVVLDKPPAPPEVEIIPYKDNADEVSFFFNPSSLQYKIKEFAFTEEERAQYQLIRDSQDLRAEELITFGGDDKTDRYYVYRIEKYPSSYGDFVNGLHKVVYTREDTVSAELLDRLTPNKKYYYIFRSVDVHGHVSPPTEVRELELINEDGTVFLNSKIVQFKEVKFEKEQKDVKRYIHIKPTLLQALVKDSILEPYSPTATAILPFIEELGHESLQKKVWGKQFKMRIKSKSTNKFVDVKFKFITKNE